MKWMLLLVYPFFCFENSQATTWYVGPSQAYTKPSQVANLVANGDTVAIEAGIYESDVARWQADNLVLRGVGGMAHLKSNGNAYGGKAIWVIAGDNTKVEYIEFSECTVPDHNGAGIRQEGHNLVVSHCYFHHNEDGILAGTVNPSTIIIEFSEFAHQGFGDGLSHNLYINNIDTLIFRYNYSHHCAIGHELKSRARVNFVEYNRLSNEETGTASRCVDLPNGGTVYMIGNVIQQGPLSENHNIIGYGLEGLSNPTPHEIYAVNNTLVNNYPVGSFFQFHAQTALFKGYNNILAGGGSFVSGALPMSIDTASNLVTNDIASLALEDLTAYDYHPTMNSNIIINKGANPGSANGVNLTPQMEYVHPSSYVERCLSGALDIGAFEYCDVLGVGDDGQFKLNVIPNPANNFVIISNNDLRISTCHIYSAHGQRMGSYSANSPIDISAFPKGLYWIVAENNADRWVGKFIKTGQ